MDPIPLDPPDPEEMYELLHGPPPPPPPTAFERILQEDPDPRSGVDPRHD